MYAKKSLGQHFLKSEKALRTIIESAEISAGETVLEIGPGQGVLTEGLLTKGASVIAVEKDDELFEFLKEKFQKEIASGQLNLIHDDILKFIENSKLEIGNYKLVANIPYNITGAILEKFLSASHQPRQIVLLVQKEVAKRIVADDNKESILSTSVKAYGIPKYVETVKAGSFVPAPKVDSAIINIGSISRNFFSDFSEKAFFQLLQAGFQSKRKKLSSNLSKICPKELVIETFKDIGLSENTRAEDIGIEIWRKLARNLSSETKRG